MKLSRHFSLLASALLAGGGWLRAEENTFAALMRDSPFGAGAPTAAVAPGAAESLPEFRSYYSDGGEQFFSVYDPGSRRSYWLRQGDTAGPLAVREFAADRFVLSIEYQGRMLPLSLRQARILALSAAPASALAAPGVASGASGNPAPDEAKSPQIHEAEKGLAEALQKDAYEKRRQLAQEKLRRARTNAAK